MTPPTAASGSQVLHGVGVGRGGVVGPVAHARPAPAVPPDARVLVDGVPADAATTRNHRDTELLRKTEPQDLIKYGLIPEFVGRLPVMGILDELDEAALVEILTKLKNALVKQYQKLFEYDGVQLEFEDEAIKEIAKEAIKRQTGARGLRSILEQSMLEVMYDIPAAAEVKKCIVTKASVTRGGRPVLVFADGTKSEYDPTKHKAESA